MYAGKAAWIDTEEGQYWKTTRDVGIDPKKLHLVTTIQVLYTCLCASLCAGVGGTVEKSDVGYALKKFVQAV